MFKWWLPSSSNSNFIWNNKIIIPCVVCICASQLPYYLDLVRLAWFYGMTWHCFHFYVCVHNHYTFVHSSFTGIKIEGDGCVIITFTVDLPSFSLCTYECNINNILQCNLKCFKFIITMFQGVHVLECFLSWYWYCTYFSCGVVTLCLINLCFIAYFIKTYKNSRKGTQQQNLYLKI